jgi:hypothetical protein
MALTLERAAVDAGVKAVSTRAIAASSRTIRVSVQAPTHRPCSSLVVPHEDMIVVK